MKMIWCLALVFFVASCGNSGLKERDKYRDLIKMGKFNEAIKFVEDNEFFNEKDNALLKNLELGMGHHLAGNFHPIDKIS